DTVFNILLDCGFDVNAVDRMRRTPLHLAAEHGMREIVRLLLAHPDITRDEDNEYGDTPLHVAVRHQRKDIAIALLEGRAYTGSYNRAGQTPLLLAIEGGSTVMVGILLAVPRVHVN
ncbi:putative ankyrin repeat protein, partial [Tuber brumale]